jgi:hypothetical protein
VQRLRDHETALLGRGDRAYRVIARHRSTGEVAGTRWWSPSPRNRSSAIRPTPP